MVSSNIAKTLFSSIFQFNVNTLNQDIKSISGAYYTWRRFFIIDSWVWFCVDFLWLCCTALLGCISFVWPRQATYIWVLSAKFKTIIGKEIVGELNIYRTKSGPTIHAYMLITNLVQSKSKKLAAVWSSKNKYMASISRVVNDLFIFDVKGPKTIFDNKNACHITFFRGLTMVCLWARFQ